MIGQRRSGSPPRNKAILPFVVCGCVVFALLGIVVVGVSAFRSGSVGVKQAGIGAEQFLAELEKQDDHAAFDLMAAQTRSGRTVV